MKRKIQDNQPWEDQYGDCLSDSKLTEVSKLWNAETWETFLNKTVDKSLSRYEKLIPGYRYDLELEEISETIWADKETQSSAVEWHETIRRLIKDHLTFDQQKIIKLIFWNDFSEQDVAKRFGVSRATVMTQKRRALSKLKHLIDSRSHEMTISKGTEQFKEISVQTLEQQIREVYCIDLQGSYIK
jgi:RNA polymerase sigma factor (sigma-70 family)